MMTSVLRLRAILLCCVFVCFTASGFAQNKDFEFVDSKFAAWSSLIANDNPPLETWANVKNKSNQSVGIAVDYVKSSITPGHSLVVCWGALCFPDHTTPFPSRSIGAGQTTDKTKGEHFDVKLTPNNVVGESRVTYRFKDVLDSTSFIDQEFVFNVRPTGIFSYARLANNSAFLSSAYPSPTSSTATFNYALPSHIQNPTLKVYDMMGKVIQSQVLDDSAGEVEINVRNLQDGIYFYSLSHQGQVLATKKLIVTH